MLYSLLDPCLVLMLLSVYWVRAQVAPATKKLVSYTTHVQPTRSDLCCKWRLGTAGVQSCWQQGDST